MSEYDWEPDPNEADAGDDDLLDEESAGEVWDEDDGDDRDDGDDGDDRM